MKIASITNLYCQQVVNEWATGLKTFNDYKIQANLVFKYAMNYDLIQKNPMEYVTMPKLQHEMFYHEDEDVDNFFTKEELKEFLARAKEDMTFKEYTLFRILAVTGLRKTLAYYDGQQVLQQPKNINSRRVIDFDDITSAILQEWQVYFASEKFRKM